MAAGLLAYNIDEPSSKTLHPRLGRKLGFRPEFVRAQDCASPEDLADLLLQSASTPPFTPVLKRQGRAVLDGGLVDNVPVDALDPAPRQRAGAGDAAVSAPAPLRAGGGQRRLYSQPSQRVPISSWDYTRPEAATDAYDLGRRDAEAFLRDWPTIRDEELLPAP